MLQIIFYTILVVVILSFFGVSLQSVITSPAGQANFNYLWNLVLTGYHFIVDSIVGFIMPIVHLFIH